MATTTSKTLSGDAWTLLFTAADPALKVGMQAMADAPVIVHVGSAPDSGDASRIGRFIVSGNDGLLDLSLDDADTVYGRLARPGAGRMTVLG